MKTLKAFILFLLIFPSYACIFELRSATFYANGTQEVSRDWFIIDFENNYGYDLFDVQFGELAYVSVIRDGERVRIDPYKNVSPKNFPLAIFATVDTFNNQSIVRYRIENEGDDVNISISIPIFSSFISCDGCSVQNESIIFSKKISKNSNAAFNITLEGSAFSIPDGLISFSYQGKVDMVFTANVPVTVEKGRGENWIGIFKVKNVLERKITGNVTAFVEFCEKSCNTTELFNEKVEVNPGETFSRSVEIKSHLVPVFFLKVNLRSENYCSVTILPSAEIHGRYLIGYANLKGFSHRIPEQVPWTGETLSPTWILPTPEVVAVPTPQIPQTHETSKKELIEKRIEVEMPSGRVFREVTIQYVLIMLPSIFWTFFATIFFPVHPRRGLVATKEQERFLSVLYPKVRIFTTPSSPARGGIVIEPDESFVSRLLQMGLDRTQAEVIAVAVKIKKPAIISNAQSAKIAISFGIPVVFYGRS